MISIKKEELSTIRKSFAKVKKDNKLSNKEIDDLVSDITQLLGIYRLEKTKEIAQLLEEMIAFGEVNNLSVQGLRIEFEAKKK